MKEEYRPISFSKTTLTELMIPSYANFGGKIHGGILLSLMDKVAYACAAKHSGSYCVTVSVDNVDFLQPVEVGDMVSMHGSVVYVGNSSMMIRIRVTSENFHQRSVKHTNTSYFTMVAKDQDGSPTTVPGLVLENDKDVRIYIEAMNRKKIRSAYKKKLFEKNGQIDVKDYLEDLEKERCLIKSVS